MKKTSLLQTIKFTAAGLAMLMAPLASHATITFTNGWEDGLVTSSDPNHWSSVQRVSSDRFRVVTDVVRTGTRAARVEVRPGDDPINSSGERAEVRTMRHANGSGNISESPGTTKYYSFSVRLDTNWQSSPETSSNWGMLLQLHEADSLGGSPPFGFYAMESFHVVLKPGGTRKITFSDGSLQRGTWVDFIVRVRWETSSTGAVEVWRRNSGQSSFTQVALSTGIPTLFDGSGSYWKHGYYRSESSLTQILWLDNMMRADTYAEAETAFGGGGGSVPPAPGSPAASAINYGQIDVSWSAASGATGYRVERKRTAGGTYTQIADTTQLNWSNTTAGTGTLYYYRVRAYNASGNGPYSAEVSATTPEVANRAGHWKFGEGSGTTVGDSSGNSNTGTAANGPAWVLSGNPIDNALAFDGVDDIVTAGSGSTLDDLPAVTVSAWIKTTSVGEGGFGRIVQKGAGTSPTGGWRLLTQGTNQLSFGADYATTDLIRVSANNVFSTGVWTHVSATWTGSATATNAKLYVNGVETSYVTTTNAVGARGIDNAASLYIGNENTLARTFNGTLDDVRVYNRVLTAAELLAVYRAGL